MTFWTRFQSFTLDDVLDKIWVKYWEYKSWITFKLLNLKSGNYMNRFVLRNTFIKIYIYHFSTNLFIKNKQSKLWFEDRVSILNVIYFLYGGSRVLCIHASHRIVGVWRVEIKEGKKKPWVKIMFLYLSHVIIEYNISVRVVMT